MKRIFAPLKIGKAFGLFAVLMMMTHAVMAQDKPVGEQIGALGRIQPASRVITMGPPNAMEGARIETLMVKEGQAVQKGDVLAYFATYAKAKATFDIAVANLNLAEANLVKVKAGSKQADILAQQARVTSISSLEKNAKLEFDRMNQLFKDGTISKARYDNAKAEWERLKATRGAEQSVLSSLSTVRGDDIKIAEANVEIAKAEKLQAEENMKLATLIAPIDSTILKIHTFEGEAVGNNGILELANLAAFDVEAEIYETDVLKLQVGQAAEVLIPGFDKAVKGKVREVGRQISRNSVVNPDPNQAVDTRVVLIRIAIDPAYNRQLERLINMKVKAVVYL